MVYGRSTLYIFIGDEDDIVGAYSFVAHLTPSERDDFDDLTSLYTILPVEKIWDAEDLMVLREERLAGTEEQFSPAQ